MICLSFGVINYLIKVFIGGRLYIEKVIKYLFCINADFWLKMRILCRFLLKMRVLCGYIDLNTHICGSTCIYEGIVETLHIVSFLKSLEIFLLMSDPMSCIIQSSQSPDDHAASDLC